MTTTMPRATVGDAGLFGPGSLAWRVDGEVLVLAGGTCALLMQLAHPAVAAGVDQHSDFRVDPFARLRRTLTSSYAVAFGTASEAEAAIRRVNAIHATVRGTIAESGAAYHATDPALLLWVHATLIDTALRVYDRYVTPLTAEEQQAYHAEARQIAIAMGIPESSVPVTLAEMRGGDGADDGRRHGARRCHRPRAGAPRSLPEAIPAARGVGHGAPHLRLGPAAADPARVWHSLVAGARGRDAAPGRRLAPRGPAAAAHPPPRATGEASRKEGRRPSLSVTPPRAVGIMPAERLTTGSPAPRPRPWCRLAGRRRTR